MPNARDATVNKDNPDRWLILGGMGTGKSTLFATLPGKKFIYIFDPNTLSSLEGFDIDYEMFNVELTDVDISIKALKADVGDKTTRNITPKTYTNWERHFESHWDKGFFNAYDWIGFDSFTLFSDIIMDRLLWLNKRTGKQPEQADWAAQVNTIGNVFRVFTGTRLGIYCTGHIDLRQDETTKKIFNRPMMTGRLRVRIPLLFNNCLISHAIGDEKGTDYSVQTRPDREFPTIRCGLRGLEMYEDVTIKDLSRPSDYGLGALLKKAGKLPILQAISSKRK